MLKKLKAFLFKNLTIRQTVAKNTFWLFFGQTVSRLIRAAIIIYAARVLGTAGWGSFSYALSLAALFTMFTDFGINAILTRESSRDLTLQEKYFSTAFIMKIVTIAVIALFLLIFAPYLIKQDEVKILIPLVILIVGFDSLRDLGIALSRAWEKMQIEATVQILTNVSIVILGFLALFLLPSAKSLTLGYALGTAIGMTAAFVPFRRYLKNITTQFSLKLIKPILSSAWPFGMLGMMGVLMLNTDILMIGWFKNIDDVGFYAAGQRITQLLYIIPMLVSVAFFPSMAKLIQDREKFKTILEKALAFLMLLAIPMAIGGFLLAKNIIELIYGGVYLPASLSFKLMNLTYPMVFVTAILGNAMFALNQERKLLSYVLLGIFGNFFFNLLLIPVWGIAGAALSTVFNQLIIANYLSYKLNKIARFSILPKLGKIITAATIMALGILALEILKIHVAIIIPLAVIIYFLLLLALKETILMEIKEIIKQPFQKKTV